MTRSVIKKEVFMTSVETFIRNYSKEILEENAAIFAGAGLSVSSGYVSWKELLREIADELKLDIDKEHDLVAIAQYHLNENRNRGYLNQKIIEKFANDARENEVHKILARLPIKTFWTTNYDSLIENALRNNRKKVDLKLDRASLAINVTHRDAVVYKMHGDILQASEAVITKDDYESYNFKRQLFTTTLQGDLVSKTFLFIGFSFEDPNLDYILSRIRLLLGENKRPHYALFRKVQREDYKNNEDYEYATIKQKLRIEDLTRYSISAVLIERYNEIQEILKQIENGLNLKNVFISGSAEEYGVWPINEALKLITELTKIIIKENFKIVTGFGFGIGSYIINAAVQIIDDSKNMHYDDYLKISPFPFQISGKAKEDFNKQYRSGILSQCGIAIFLFGNKKKDGIITNADGVLEEFKIAKEKNLVIIPIGSTGYAAKIVQEIVREHISEYPYLKDYADILSESIDIDEICRAVIKIIKSVQN
jgi:hypothetical protein